DRVRWERRWAESAREGGPPRAPSAWVVERALERPAAALVVDLAGGDGRHAAPLAAAGRRVVAVDIAEGAVREAVRRGAAAGVVADLGALPFAPATFDVVLVVNFLDRGLFPTLGALLRPGGVLVYETYVRDHLALVASGRARAPRNPAYVLAPGELPRLVAPLEVVAAREGLVTDEAGERCVSSVVAVRR
ncbi:MAG: class I SAM-dependent methyltransferase, partial [Gemmatimonadaceae bacterium]